MARGAEDLSYTVAILRAKSKDATYAFEHSYNEKRLISTADTSKVSRRQRESTPSVNFTEASIRLSLREREKPFDPQKGFMFGSGTDNDNVDIMLHPIAGECGVSRKHFTINFDWKDKTLILANHSRKGTYIESQTGDRHLTGNEAATLRGGDTIRAGVILMRIVFPERRDKQAIAFAEHLETYRQECIAAMPRLQAMVLSPSDQITITESENLKIVKSIGKGVFAEVYKAVANSGEYFAVKIFNRSSGVNHQRITRERTNLARTQHPNIVQSFYGKIVETPFPYIVMEYVELGTLDDYLDLSVPQLNWTFRQICHGVAYLHQMDMAHRDLKPANILMKSIFPVHIAIADFGLASQEALLTMCGSYQYAAPEVFFSFERETYTPKVDVWSVGIMMLQYSAAHEPGQVPLPWQVTNWLPILGTWQDGPATVGREHLSTWSRRMLIQNAFLRPEMHEIVGVVDGYVKNQIRRWVVPRPGDEGQAAICLTELLDYLGLDPNIISRILAKSLKRADTYKVDRQPPREARGRRRDVYTSWEHTLDIVKERLPSVVDLIDELAQESTD